MYFSERLCEKLWMHPMPSLPSYPTDLNDLEWVVVDGILGEPPGEL